jgi:hypothetical protein
MDSKCVGIVSPSTTLVLPNALHVLQGSFLPLHPIQKRSCGRVTSQGDQTCAWCSSDYLALPNGDDDMKIGARTSSPHADLRYL